MPRFQAEGVRHSGGNLIQGALALLGPELAALPAARERAAEILSLLEGVAPGAPEAEAARIGLLDELARLGSSAIAGADAARAAGLDPLTLRTVAADAGVGANLLAVAPLPGG